MITRKQKEIITRFFSYEEIRSFDDFSYKIDIHWDYIYSIPEFAALKNLRQNPKWHSESEFISGHVELVAEKCKQWIKPRINPSNEEQMIVLMLSSIFHDVGKATTTFFKEKDQQWHHYGHEIESEKITRRILWDLGCDIREKVCGLVRWHMEPLNLMRSKDAPIKILELQNKVCSIRLLYMLKFFDSEGAIPANPETCRFDKKILLEFVQLANELKCFDSPNKIDKIEKRVGKMINYDKRNIDAYLYMGLPGAGKDTDIANRFHDRNAVVFCRDDIRVELGYCGESEKYLGNTDEENKVTEVFNTRLMEAAKNGDTIILNNMNNRRKYRDGYKNLLKNYNVTWHYIYVEADCLEKNIDRRKGQIEPQAFTKMVESFEYPTPDEYDDILIVTN